MSINIFIDTSVFIQENFFSSRKIQRLAMLSNQNKVNLFITSVIDLEIKSNIKKNIFDLKQFNTKFKRNLDNKYKIIKNLEDYYDIKYKDDHFEDELLMKYDRFLKFGKVNIIYPEQEFDISFILSQYYNSEPPFNKTKKKAEFPDAISLKIIEDYCNKNSIEVYHLSKDKDFENIVSNSITFIDDINYLFRSLSKQFNPESIQNFEDAYQFVIEYKNEYKKLIELELEVELVVHFITLFNAENNLNIEDVHINKIEIKEYLIDEIEDNLVSFRCKGVFKSKVLNVFNDSYPNERYDKYYSNNYHFVNKNMLNLKGEFNASLYYSYEYPYKPVDEIEIDEDEKKIIKLEQI